MSGLLESLPQSREALGILAQTPARRSPGENREYVRALLPLLAEARRKGHGFVKIAETAERSEERRVGKECRSRWSPYH